MNVLNSPPSHPWSCREWYLFVQNKAIESHLCLPMPSSRLLLQLTLVVRLNFMPFSILKPNGLYNCCCEWIKHLIILPCFCSLMSHCFAFAWASFLDQKKIYCLSLFSRQHTINSRSQQSMKMYPPWQSSDPRNPHRRFLHWDRTFLDRSNQVHRRCILPSKTVNNDWRGGSTQTCFSTIPTCRAVSIV